VLFAAFFSVPVPVFLPAPLAPASELNVVDLSGGMSRDLLPSMRIFTF
jgi:hypothetical protein